MRVVDKRRNEMTLEEGEVKMVKCEVGGEVEWAIQPAGEVTESVEVQRLSPNWERLAGHCGLCTTR